MAGELRYGEPADADESVKNLVLGFAVFESFARRDNFRVFTPDEFWAHSLSTAAAAKLFRAPAQIEG